MFTLYIPVHSGIKTALYLSQDSGSIQNQVLQDLAFKTGTENYGVGRGNELEGGKMKISKNKGGEDSKSTSYLQLVQNNKGIWGFSEINIKDAKINSEDRKDQFITDMPSTILTHEINKGVRYEKMFFQANTKLVEVCNSIVHKSDNVPGNYYNIPFFDRVKKI